MDRLSSQLDRSHEETPDPDETAIGFGPGDEHLIAESRHHLDINRQLFDLAELEELDRSLRLFSIKRFNLFGFDPSDHGCDDVASLRQWVKTTLAKAGVDLEGGAVRLLAIPRVMGYVFNPLSVWYCFGPDEEVRAVIHEVRNTFGDRHVYVVPVDRKSVV